MKRIFKIFIFLVLLIVLSFGAGGYFYLKSLNPADTVSSIVNKNKSNEKDKKINILILGLDETSPTDPKRSDTMLVISYDPKTNKGSMLSIPRDTMINLPKYGTQKINAAYPIGGYQLAIDEVSQLIGEPIDYYVRISFEGFVQLVNELGGVEVNVPMNMDYDDNSGGLHIHLKKGLQTLNGQQALELVRFRHGYAEQDLGRVKVQREFVLALLDKAKNPAILLKINSILKTINQYVETNIPPGTMIKYANYVIKMDKNDIKSATLPGNPQYIDGIAYYITDPNEIKSFMRSFNDLTTPDKDKTNTVISSNIKIEILNGGGIPGAAAKTAEILKEQGYDIIKIGNVSGITYNNTQIINRTKDKNIIESLQKILKNSIIVDDTGDRNTADVTIILGKNI